MDFMIAHFEFQGSGAAGEYDEGTGGFIYLGLVTTYLLILISLSLTCPCDVFSSQHGTASDTTSI